MEARVAEAITDVTWERMRELNNADALACARAAIRAMREPTDEMVDVGRRSHAATSGDCHAAARVAFAAMIDAASPPEET